MTVKILTINDRLINARESETVLEVARDADIHRVATDNLSLAIPLENDATASLTIPKSLDGEWLQVADRNYHAPFPKLTNTFEFAC